MLYLSHDFYFLFDFLIFCFQQRMVAVIQSTLVKTLTELTILTSTMTANVNQATLDYIVNLTLTSVYLPPVLNPMFAITTSMVTHVTVQ